MATRLVHPNPNIQQAMRALARTNTPRVTIQGQAPFAGYVPDLDPNQLGANACSEMANLVPGVVTGVGAVLKQPPGFDMIDEANLELGSHANTTNDILLLAFFPRVNSAGAISGEWDDTVLAISAGNGATAGSCQLYRLQPSTDNWQEIVHSGNANSIAMMGGYPATGGDTHLPDWAIMPSGATPRTGLSAGSDGVNPPLTEPAFVWCNLLDPVMVYPVVDGGTTESGDYEILTRAFGNGANAFRARSVEAWGDRLNYLNTIENSVHYRQRLRRTSLGNADPDPAGPDGSGSMDFRHFTEDGLRVESLGNLLACYFGDGVAVIRRSGNPTAPYEQQILTTKRGLLSTHSLANLGDGTHFGIFTDGFFFLNSSGQFTEAGLADMNGTPTHKWKRTFLERLDVDLRERIFLHYDHTNRWIWMSLPLDGATNNQEVWIYDPFGDRIFPAPIPITVMGTVNRQIRAGITIGALPGTIGGLTGTIGSYGPLFGTKVTIHGTHNGLVMAHDPDLTTQINLGSRLAEEASYRYRSVLSSTNSPRTLKTVERLLMEYVGCDGGDPTFQIFGNPGVSQQGIVVLNAGPGELSMASRHFRISGRQLGFEVAGQGPVQIRRFELDAFDYGVEPGT